MIKKKIKTQSTITLTINKNIIQSLLNVNSKDPLINEIQDQCYKLSDKQVVVYLCHQMTEDLKQDLIECKVLAKSAIESHNRITYDLIQIKTIKNSIKAKLINEWNSRWQQSNTGAQTKKYFPTIEHRLKVNQNLEINFNLTQNLKINFNLTQNLKINFNLTQILTNHGNMNSYLKRFEIKDTDECSECIGCEDDSDHRVYDCVKYEEQRKQFIDRVRAEVFIWPLNQSLLLNYKLINHFIEFTKHLINSFFSIPYNIMNVI